MTRHEESTAKRRDEASDDRHNEESSQPEPNRQLSGFRFFFDLSWPRATNRQGCRQRTPGGEKTMSNTRIDPTQTATVQVDQARVRTTTQPQTPFANVLAGGANALLTGAEVAGGAIGGPVVAAAIRQARTSVADTGGGGAGGVAGGAGSPMDSANGVVNAGSPSAEIQAMHAMNRESQSFNLQMLALQEEVQQENRRFTMLTNVVRARHDTAKGAISNIRS
jgi:hypothetical protein